MTTSTRTTETPRTWLPTRIAGAAVTTAVTALLVLGTAGSSTAKFANDEPTGRQQAGSTSAATNAGSPCHITPHDWPVRELGPVPRCHHHYGSVTP
jgi:hypothetical protein